MVGAIVGRILAKFFKWVGLSWLDRLLGGAFGVVRGFVIAAAMVTVLLAFAPSPPPPSVVDSRLLPYVINVSDVLAAADAARNEGPVLRHKRQSEGGLVRAQHAQAGGAPARMNLLIFDLDGTLVDSKLDLVHSVNAARALMNLAPISEELVSSYVGNGAPVLMRRALGPEASEADVARALEYFPELLPRAHARQHASVSGRAGGAGPVAGRGAKHGGAHQ